MKRNILFAALALGITATAMSCNADKSEDATPRNYGNLVNDGIEEVGTKKSDSGRNYGNLTNDGINKSASAQSTDSVATTQSTAPIDLGGLTNDGIKP